MTTNGANQRTDLQMELDDLDFADAIVEDEDEFESVSEEDGKDQEKSDEEEDDLSGDSGEESSEEDEDSSKEGDGESGDERESRTGESESGVPEVDQEALDAISELAKLRKEKADLEAKLAKTETSVEDPSEEPAFEYSETHDFLGDQDLYQLTSDPVAFNQFMNSVVKQAVEAAYNTTSKGIMLSVPKIVSHQSAQDRAIEAAVNKFYSDNADLVEIKPQVAQVAAMIASEHSDWDMEKVFDEAGKKTRRLLKMPDPSTITDNEEDFTPTKTKPPKGKKRGKGKRQKLSALQQELDEL